MTAFGSLTGAIRAISSRSAVWVLGTLISKRDGAVLRVATEASTYALGVMWPGNILAADGI